LVRRATSHRLDFDAAAIYQYPEHLRQWLEGLPKVPGVYTFHGESEICLFISAKALICAAG